MSFFSAWKFNRYVKRIRDGGISLSDVVDRIEKPLAGDDTSLLWQLLEERIADHLKTGNRLWEVKRCCKSLQFVKEIPKPLVELLAQSIERPWLTDSIGEALSYFLPTFPDRYFKQHTPTDSKTRLLIVLGKSDFFNHPEEAIPFVKHFGSDGLADIEKFMLKQSLLGSHAVEAKSHIKILAKSWYIEYDGMLFCNAMTFYCLAGGQPTDKFSSLLQEICSLVGTGIAHQPSLGIHQTSFGVRAVCICCIVLGRAKTEAAWKFLDTHGDVWGPLQTFRELKSRLDSD